MIHYIMLITGVFLLSSTITYMWWTKFRIIVLRQELFLIRDNLWFEMQEAGKLDDPGYQFVRSSFNRAIQAASLWSFTFLLQVQRTMTVDDREIKNTHKMIMQAPEPVHRALRDMRYQLLRYLFAYTIPGNLWRIRFWVSTHKDRLWNNAAKSLKNVLDVMGSKKADNIDWRRVA